MSKKLTENKKPKTCQAVRYEGSHCGRVLYDDKHCIFHSKNIKGKKMEFNEAFWKEFERQKKEYNVYDFSGFIFPDSISFKNIEFKKNTCFIDAKFLGNKTSFMDTKFLGKDTAFIRTKFAGEQTDFMEASFFAENTYFLGVNFSAKNTRFSHAKSSGNFYINGSKFTGKYIDFSHTEFIGKISDFGGSNFTGKYIEFTDSNLKNVYGLFDALVNKGISRIFKGKYKISNFKFFLGDESAKRHPVIDRMTKDAWYLSDYQNQHPFVYKIWNISSKCGQKISYWVGWSLLFATFFALKFYLIYLSFPSLFHFNPAIKTHSFWSFVYYSFVTFTTLGFGDIIPTVDWVQGLVIAEVVLGYIMLGGLISIFANKLARRS